MGRPRLIREPEQRATTLDTVTSPGFSEHFSMRSPFTNVPFLECSSSRIHSAGVRTILACLRDMRVPGKTTVSVRVISLEARPVRRAEPRTISTSSTSASDHPAPPASGSSQCKTAKRRGAEPRSAERGASSCDVSTIVVPARAPPTVRTAAEGSRAPGGSDPTCDVATNCRPLPRTVRMARCTSGESSSVRRARLTAWLSEASVTVTPCQTVSSSSFLVTTRSRWRAR